MLENALSLNVTTYDIVLYENFKDIIPVSHN